MRVRNHQPGREGGRDVPRRGRGRGTGRGRGRARYRGTYRLRCTPGAEVVLGYVLGCSMYSSTGARSGANTSRASQGIIVKGRTGQA